MEATVAHYSTTSIVAAAPRSFARLVWIEPETNSRPTPDDVGSIYMPIVAWRILGDSAKPVFPLPPPDGAVALLPVPVEQWLNYRTGDVYHTFAEARDEILAAAQRGWDRAQEGAQ